MKTRQQEAEAARGRMKTYLETKKAETDAKIDEWKAQREVQKLQDRANDAEAYFGMTLDVAAAAIDEAGAAALEAIEACRVADEATAPGSGPRTGVTGRATSAGKSSTS